MIESGTGIYKLYVLRSFTEVPIHNSESKVLLIKGSKKYGEYNIPTTDDTSLEN